MTVSLFNRLSESLSRSREQFTESMNVLFNRGPKLDDDFWDELEETLILNDFGVFPTQDIILRLQNEVVRKGLPDAYAVCDLLAETIAGRFVECEHDPFLETPSVVLFVGINGSGKTTTVGKLAHATSDAGKKVLIGSADTFRAAAIEQLDVWARRADVEVVKRDRGSDPASVCFETVERAESLGSDLVLIDTSGRLHTSSDLMRELEKVVATTRKRADAAGYAVQTVLVMDATTGRNGLQQGLEFDKALDLNGVIMTKLDGTAKGGIALAVSRAIKVPILRIGVGEGIDDLRPFDAREFAEALISRSDA